MAGCGTFWHHFMVLTWKNNILRRKNWKSWLVEIFVPVALTFGMLAIYKSVDPQVTDEYIPEDVRSVRFDHFYASYGEPQCSWYDSNIFWRCPRDDCTPDLCNKLTFAFAPATTSDPAAAAAANALRAQVLTLTGGNVDTLVFPSEQALDAYMAQPEYALSETVKNIGVGVVFDSAGPDWKYHLRMNRTVNEGFNYNVPPTTLDTDVLLKTPYDWPKACSRCQGTYQDLWYNSGGLTVQNLVDSFIVSQAAGTPIQLTASVVSFPSPAFQQAGFWGIVQAFYGIFMVIAILYPVSNVVRSLVMEKEARIREGMRMMALTDGALYASWAFHFATTFTIIAVLIVGVGGKLFQYSDKVLVFLYYLLFFFSTTAFGFWMSTFFSKSKTAAILGVLPYFGGYFITMALKPETGRGAKLLACLHPSAAFTLAMSAFAEYEDAQQGVTRFNYTTSAVGTFAFSDALGMMFVDIFLYAFLFWYFDKVWPSEFGTRLPPYFFLMPSYWKGCCFGVARGSAAPFHAVTDVEAALAHELTPDMERVPDTLASQIKEGKCIYIRDLCKTYKTNTGLKHAVDNLNLTMYSGQITALLGHNGAGKSTTIGILSGLSSPSSGQAYINGLDVSRDMQKIRHSLGVCPQHDVLFADLSVEEHLTLFASFKGMARREIPAAVEEMIKEVGLTEKRKVASKNLSGGMKRKLSVGIAFIGGSKVVFLDEPTSGMDPFSRRFTWNVIRKYREGRTIILTTHFLEEADLLGDRIAIMAKGKLRACGSSLFLKNHFGVGYLMVVEKKTNANATRIQQYVLNKIPEGKVLSSVGAEVSFQLPRSCSSTFVDLFNGLDKHKEELGIENYGVSVTTLEEVFIRVTRGDETDVAEKAAISVRRNSLEERRQSLEDSRHMRRLSSNVLGGGGNGKAGGAGLDSSLPPLATAKSLKAVKELHGDGDAKTPPLGGGANYSSHRDSDKDALGIDYSDHWNFFRRHMYALLVKRFLYFRRDKKAWVYQFVMPACFVLAGCMLMKAGVNSIFAQKMPPLTLSLAGYNPSVRTNPNPFPYNAEGNPFTYNDWGNVQTNNNVVGQQAVMAEIPASGALPTYTYVTPAVVNMSQTLLDTRNDWKASRYGAVTFGVVDNTQEFLYNVHANFTGAHAPAIFQNLINDAILRQYLPAGSITTMVTPLPVTKNEVATASSFDGFTIVVMIMLSFAFIPAAFALFVVRERETKAKHLQIVSGVSFLSYWFSTWVFDFLSYQIPLWLTIIILKAFDAKALIGEGNLGPTIVLLELFGASVTGFTYLISFAFRTHSMAQVGTILINFLFGLILMIVTVIMTFIPTTRGAALKLVFAFRLVPAYAAGNGLLNLVFMDMFSMLDGKAYTPYSLKISGYAIIYMAIETVVFLLLTLLLEYLIRRPTVAKLLGGAPLSATAEQVEKDVDVAKEEVRVKTAPEAEDDVVLIKDMTKMYKGGKFAVKGISLGVPNGECFGLLGVNGAGKTSTLSILTAEFPPSSGSVRLGGYDIAENPDVVRRLVGYCPQFDALFDLLTGREHLELYARVKGLSEAQVKEVVDQKVKEMDLVEYAGRNATTYSGGNKRKLSVAMAMIGRPLICFLDEPSTGMDAVARRFMWKVISDITTKRQECCVILTTHSMEECEALCTRIGIMVSGRLQCLGAAQHLKSRFGAGYQVEISVQLPPPVDVDSIVSMLQATCPETPNIQRFTMAQVKTALELINKRDWVERIAATGTGADVWQTVTSVGSIGVRELASWCRLEKRMDSVLGFVNRLYADAILRERQGTKLRFEIPAKDSKTGKPRLLSQMFGNIEDKKEDFFIEDYSVSQTSLEQIFNFFAAQQEEEKGAAAGIVGSGSRSQVVPAAAPAGAGPTAMVVAQVGDSTGAPAAGGAGGMTPATSKRGGFGKVQPKL